MADCPGRTDRANDDFNRAVEVSLHRKDVLLMSVVDFESPKRPAYTRRQHRDRPKREQIEHDSFGNREDR